MATFVTHGLMGAALTTAVVHAVGHSPERCITAAVLGFVAGTLPDTADWIAATVFGAERWTLYSRMHTGDLEWLGLIVWPMGLHTMFDRPFHEIPGENWWPRLWWLEAIGALTSLAVLGMVFL